MGRTIFQKTVPKIEIVLPNGCPIFKSVIKCHKNIYFNTFKSKVKPIIDLSNFLPLSISSNFNTSITPSSIIIKKKKYKNNKTDNYYLNFNAYEQKL